jgi:hypothetical protein
LDICKRLLDRYGVEEDHFLERIFMGDETWIHHYETQSKHQSMEWKHPHLPPSPSNAKKFKMHPTAGKLCLQFLGLTSATNGTLSRDGYNSEQCSLHCDMLTSAIRRKQRGILSEGVVFFLYNSCLHTLAHTVKPLKKLYFELLELSLYSSDLALSDYNLFDPLK